MFPQYQFLFLTNHSKEEKLAKYPNVTEWSEPLSSYSMLRLWWWWQYTLPAILKKQNAAILINCSGLTSLRTNIPQILLLDGLPPGNAGARPGSFKKLWRRSLSAGIKKSKAIVLPSHFLKELIVKQYAVLPGLICVSGAGPITENIPLFWEEKEAVKIQFSGGREYFLVNNLAHTPDQQMAILKAFSIFKKRLQSNMQLLLASNTDNGGNSLVNKISNFKYRTDVHLLSGTTENEMAMITAAAYTIINISRLPTNGAALLQALQCNVPLIVDSSGAASSWLGEAALYTLADVPEKIAEQMMMMYKDEHLRNRLIAEGTIQLAKNNWEDAATRFGNCIEAVIKAS